MKAPETLGYFLAPVTVTMPLFVSDPAGIVTEIIARFVAFDFAGRPE